MAMVHSTFRMHLAELLNELSQCYTLCDTIRLNRRLGSTLNLDRLQEGLKSSINSIQIQFNTLRKLVGQPLEVGDESSRRALATSVGYVQDYIKARLDDIAYRHYQQEIVPRGTEVPGFREILRQWHSIEDTVTTTLDALSLRLDKPAPAPQPRPILKPALAPAPAPKSVQIATPTVKADNVVISLKELDKLLDHMKNCWIEKVVDGGIIYQNCFDETRWRFERPEGYVKELPKRHLKRKVSWERLSPKSSSKPLWDGR